MKPLILNIILVFLTSFSCKENKKITPQEPQKVIQLSYKDLIAKFELLPEKRIAYNKDSTTVAFYAKPTKRYRHGILGDKIEAGELVVIKGSAVFKTELSEKYVYEDLVPRLVDVDKDRELEVVCIRTDANKGAGIVIYKIANKQLTEYAFVKEIGTGFRWLNIATIDDLDNDGTMELAWVQTPHIGGILKIAKINKGELEILDSFRGVSNHAIGSRNLDLSIVKQKDQQKTLYLPNQARNKVFSFTFSNNKWEKTGEIDLKVDFSKSLKEQVSF